MLRGAEISKGIVEAMRRVAALVDV